MEAITEQEEITRIIREQLARDYNCKVEDFGEKKIVINDYKKLSGARGDFGSPFMRAVSYQGTAALMVSDGKKNVFEKEFKDVDGDWLFEYEQLNRLDKIAQSYNHHIQDIHEYFVPCMRALVIESVFPIKWFEQDQIVKLKQSCNLEQAFADVEECPDVLAVAAMSGGNIMAVAGASADSDTMWQIGIDVLPEYRRKGIGNMLVDILKQEILRRGKVPFYGTVPSHHISKMIAHRAGFLPAWTEIYTD